MSVSPVSRQKETALSSEIVSVEWNVIKRRCETPRTPVFVARTRHFTFCLDISCVIISSKGILAFLGHFWNSIIMFKRIIGSKVCEVEKNKNPFTACTWRPSSASMKWISAGFPHTNRTWFPLQQHSGAAAVTAYVARISFPIKRFLAKSTNVRSSFSFSHHRAAVYSLPRWHIVVSMGCTHFFQIYSNI